MVLGGHQNIATLKISPPPGSLEALSDMRQAEIALLRWRQANDHNVEMVDSWHSRMAGLCVSYMQMRRN